MESAGAPQYPHLCSSLAKMARLDMAVLRLNGTFTT
jgi:hypothetical protein